MTDTATPLYDVELGLREAARHRQRRDELSRVTCGLGDRLAEHMVRHFGPEATETAGLALVIGAASIAALAVQDINPRVMSNILALAGQRMVGDARAAQGGA